MPLQIQIATGGHAPIYRQIFDQIRLAVATGRLAPDERLPSVRAQAERLLINPNTVARAYNELLQAGVVRSHPGRGLFVNSQRTVFKKSERRRRLEPFLEACVYEAVALGFSTDEILEEVRRKLASLDIAPRASGSSSDE